MKKRAGGYFGLHFDFHAGTDNQEIGANTTREMIDIILNKVNPDYVQCDCKGHPGLSSYPTKVGNPAPGIKKDALKVWREATKAKGIPLIMHYSGVWDTRAIALNPDWARINEDGNPDKNSTSTFSKYVDELLIPQLKELALDWKVDGVWVDGECWANAPDFNKEVVEAFKKETGYTEISKDLNDPSRQAFNDYNRKQFFIYLNKYIDSVHSVAPDFEIASNWAFSSHIPEKVCANVNFLSGDFSPSDSYNSARFEARALARQGLPWDLMAWGFCNSGNGGQSTKSFIALEREGAAVLSLGGGFQIYNTQFRDGSVKLWEMDNMVKIADFCRKRQKWCEGSKPLPVAAVLFSKTDAYTRCNMFLPGGKERIDGAVRLVLDTGKPVDVLNEYHITENFEDRKTIILPECKKLPEEISQKIREHVNNGGSLIISGADCCKMFEDIAGVKITKTEDTTRYINYNNHLARQKSIFGKIELNGADILTNGYEENDYNPQKKHIVATVNKYGKGTVIAFAWDMFEGYYRNITFTVRDLMNEALSLTEPEPLAQLYEGVKTVDIIPAQKDRKMLINLINTCGIYLENRLQTYDEIAPLYNIKIKVKAQKPQKITLQPENKIIPFEYDGKNITFTVDKLDIHTIAVIE